MMALYNNFLLFQTIIGFFQKLEHFNSQRFLCTVSKKESLNVFNPAKNANSTKGAESPFRAQKNQFEITLLQGY